MKNLGALWLTLVGIVAILFWGRAAPADDDSLAQRFREGGLI